MQRFDITYTVHFIIITSEIFGWKFSKDDRLMWGVKVGLLLKWVLEGNEEEWIELANNNIIPSPLELKSGWSFQRSWRCRIQSLSQDQLTYK
jgi:hypothetical protein